MKVKTNRPGISSPYAHDSQCATLGGPLLERGSGLMSARPDDTERAIRACSNSASALVPRPALNSRITAPMPFNGVTDGATPVNGTNAGPSGTITNLDERAEDGSENSSLCFIEKEDIAA